MKGVGYGVGSLTDTVCVVDVDCSRQSDTIFSAAHYPLQPIEVYFSSEKKGISMNVGIENYCGQVAVKSCQAINFF